MMYLCSRHLASILHDYGKMFLVSTHMHCSAKHPTCSCKPVQVGCSTDAQTRKPWLPTVQVP